MCACLCLSPTPTLGGSDLAGLEGLLRICVFKKLPVNSDAVGDPQSALQVSVIGSQRSQYCPPYEGPRTGSPVGSGHRDAYCGLPGTQNFHSKRHVVLPIAFKGQVRVWRHTGRQAFPEGQEHLLQSVFFFHPSPVCMKPATACSIACSTTSPSPADKIWFPELPDICVATICGLSLKVQKE